jgi:hypothetical protein
MGREAGEEPAADVNDSTSMKIESVADCGTILRVVQGF